MCCVCANAKPTSSVAERKMTKLRSATTLLVPSSVACAIAEYAYAHASAFA